MTDDYRDTIVPIQLRDGLIVRIGGIPRDLTPKEAEKIGNVVKALALKDTPRS